MDFLIVCATCHQEIKPGVAHDHQAPLMDTQQRGSTERPGHYAVENYRSVAVPNPAAGTDLVVTVPFNVRWEVQNFSALLTDSAAVANRVPHLFIDDGLGNVSYNYPAPANLVAGASMLYSAGIGVVGAAFDGATMLVLPVASHLSSNWRVGFKTSALDVADQWSKCVLIVQEWINF
jgi:hypothetical protein